MEKKQNGKRPLALLTGGSSGIGLELARCFARDGYRLLLAAWPAEPLQAAAAYLQREYGAPVHPIAMDLSRPGSAEALHQAVLRQYETPDVLVNSAGFGTYGFFNDIPLERERAMIQLNAVTLYELTRLFAADMIRRDHGRILNVASISAWQPNPQLAAYGATKAFVMNYTRAINYELRQRGSAVRLTALCPPPSPTPFMRAAGMEKIVMYRGLFALAPERIAREGYRALQRGRELCIPGWHIRTLADLLQRILPPSLKFWFVSGQLRQGDTAAATLSDPLQLNE